MRNASQNTPRITGEVLDHYRRVAAAERIAARNAIFRDAARFLKNACARGLLALTTSETQRTA